MRRLATSSGVNLDEAYAEVSRFVPARRAAEAQEIASVVQFLTSSATSFITGAVIPVDGGAHVVDVGSVAFDSR